MTLFKQWARCCPDNMCRAASSIAMFCVSPHVCVPYPVMIWTIVMSGACVQETVLRAPALAGQISILQEQDEQYLSRPCSYKYASQCASSLVAFHRMSSKLNKGCEANWTSESQSP